MTGAYIGCIVGLYDESCKPQTSSVVKTFALESRT